MHDLSAVTPIAAQAEGGGVDWFLIIMLAALALMFFFTITRGRKAQQEQAQMRSRLAPGDEVMTGAGIFGHVRAIDEENQRVTLELSPATFADVHLQTISRIVEDETAARVADAPSGADAAVDSSSTGSRTVAEGDHGRSDRPDDDRRA